MADKISKKQWALILALGVCFYIIASLLVGARWVFRLQLYFTKGYHIVDSTGDGKPDYWERYKNGKLVESAWDLNGDGKPDVWNRFGPNEEMTLLEGDFNLDGKIDYREIWENGVCLRIEKEVSARGKMETFPCTGPITESPDEKEN